MKPPKEIIEYSTDPDHMVTIDEIFKDDPAALRELQEMRKYMDENPDLFNFPEEKKTQGQEKMKQLLEDARRNAKFQRMIRAAAKTEHSPDKIRALKTVYGRYILFLASLQKYREKFLFKSKAYKAEKSISKEYGIDPILFDRLLASVRSGRLEGWDFAEDSVFDTCVIEMNHDETDAYDMHSFHVLLVDGMDSNVYPLKIKINRFASKRDILDFIEKKWDEIKPHLHEKRIRQRKTPRDIVDFIWKYRSEKTKEIQRLFKKKYPQKRSPLYFEINKIISEEKKRRAVK